MTRIIKIVPLVVLCALIIAVPSAWANWVQDGVAICTATGDQTNPTIVSDGVGGAIVTWWDYRPGSGSLIYAQRVNASGATLWTANGVALCTVPGNPNVPAIASDGSGGAIATWCEYRGENFDIYAQRVDASGVVRWTANAIAICTAAGNKGDPTIVSDGAGGAIVTWRDGRASDYDIYAQRVGASGVVQWTADGVALCTAPNHQQSPTITSDGAGGAIITWEDYRSGLHPDIYAQRVNASGAVQWSADGVALCTANSSQDSPMIASDGAGGAIVTWMDGRSWSNNDIYAQRVDASGAVRWTADGVAICATPQDQWYPQIASDGADGAIVTWWDYRSMLDPDLYAQKVDASGAVQWTANGVALCAATGDQSYPTIVCDGAGGAIIAWKDGRSAHWDIYAQRVNTSGSIQWTPNGVPLCTATGDQLSQTIVSDGTGGATVAWQDSRSGSYHIYAQRVVANGFALLTGTDAPVMPIELHQNYPNPFNPTTTVAYSIAEKSNVALKIYDVSGKCIASLVDREQEKGSYAVEWSGKDEQGKPMASGIYLYRLAAGSHTITKKMVLLR